MKRLPIILNVVLLLAIGLLYLLHFGVFTTEETTEESIGTPERKEIDVTSGIAFVLIDSVIVNFDMFSEKLDELEGKQNRAERELNTKGQAYERAYLDAQDKVSKGLVTRATAQEMEQNLMRQQQELMDLRERLQYELMEEEEVMNRQILDYITTYLESVKAEMNYQFVFGKTFGGPVLYGDNALDITTDVITGLNNKYRTDQTGTR